MPHRGLVDKDRFGKEVIDDISEKSFRWLMKKAELDHTDFLSKTEKD